MQSIWRVQLPEAYSAAQATIYQSVTTVEVRR